MLELNLSRADLLCEYFFPSHISFEEKRFIYPITECTGFSDVYIFVILKTTKILFISIECKYRCLYKIVHFSIIYHHYATRMITSANTLHIKINTRSQQICVKSKKSLFFLFPSMALLVQKLFNNFRHASHAFYTTQSFMFVVHSSIHCLIAIHSIDQLLL